MTKKAHNPAAVALGTLGGNSTLKKYGGDHFKRLSELALKAKQEKAEAQHKSAS